MTIDIAAISKKRLEQATEVDLDELGITVWMAEPSALALMKLNARMREIGLIDENTKETDEIEMSKLDPKQQLEWMEVMIEMVHQCAILEDGSQAFTLEAVQSLGLKMLEKCTNSLSMVKAHAGTV